MKTSEINLELTEKHFELIDLIIKVKISKLNKELNELQKANAKEEI